MSDGSLPSKKESPRPSDERNGCFLDGTLCCKVCDGEIPYGHTEECDIFKLEDELHRLKAMGSAPETKSNWHPIDSAPKDGKAILVASGNWIVTAHWHRYQGCWASCGPTYERLPADEQPELWMPIPELPSAADSAQETKPEPVELTPIACTCHVTWPCVVHDPSPNGTTQS